MNSCNQSSACEPIVEIIQGEKRVLTVQILDVNSVGQDMTGVSQVWASFPSKVSGEFVTKKLTDVVDPIQILTGTSNVKITLGPSNTGLLKPARGQLFYVAVQFPGSLGKRVFKVGSYDVIEAPQFA